MPVGRAPEPAAVVKETHPNHTPQRLLNQSPCSYSIPTVENARRGGPARAGQGIKGEIRVGATLPQLRLGIVDSTGEVHAILIRCGIAVALRRLAAAADPLAEPRCDLLVHASYGMTDWTAVGRSAARIPTVVLATPATDDDAYRALEAGAFGYVDAALPVEALARALVGALHGEPAFPRRVFADLVRRRSESGLLLRLGCQWCRRP